MLPHVVEESGFTSFRVGFYLDAGDRDTLVASLDDCLHTVAETRDDVQSIK